jgi:hypothetical protein
VDDGLLRENETVQRENELQGRPARVPHTATESGGNTELSGTERKMVPTSACRRKPRSLARAWKIWAAKQIRKRNLPRCSLLRGDGDLEALAAHDEKFNTKMKQVLAKIKNNRNSVRRPRSDSAL